MQRDKRNNKESDEYNKETTQGKKTIRITKSKNTKVGQQTKYACTTVEGQSAVQTDSMERGYVLYYTIYEFIENLHKIALIGNILFQSPTHAYS